jgi:hypothetical protein
VRSVAQVVEVCAACAEIGSAFPTGSQTATTDAGIHASSWRTGICPDRTICTVLPPSGACAPGSPIKLAAHSPEFPKMIRLRPWERPVRDRWSCLHEGGRTTGWH